MEIVPPKKSENDGFEVLYQGYGMHNKVNVLSADDTIVCKEFN